jgi:phenylpyruvate tautomerase PptA (4-oxalocrotonate tautomerase family)
MPILDIEVVCTREDALRLPSAQALADVVGRTLGTPAGRTWVRLRPLEASQYAENETAVRPDERPVFVTVLHGRPPEGGERALEALALTRAVAMALGHREDRVHVQYAPAAAGRQAFGGRLVE